MEENYNDEKLPDNFEVMAKAYSQSLKNKGFVFIKLEEEEYALLLDEIAVLFEKILASLKILNEKADCTIIWEATKQQQADFIDKFSYNRKHKFKCIESADNCFLSLVSLENMLTLKLMVLSVKSGELEFCNNIIISRTKIYADSFSCEGFVVERG